MTEIVKRLKAITQDQNIKQRELAKRMRTTETSVSRWFNGSRIPDAKNLEQMAAALGYRLTIEDERNKRGMGREEENRMILSEAIKRAESKPTGTYEEMVSFQLGLIATMLADISKSLAILADKKESDKESEE